MKLNLRNRKGFTLIELLIVVAIIGIIAAIAIPNLLNAIQRGRQKRTMSDMRTIGTAVETYAVDYNRYPKQATCGNVSGINAFISPDYIKSAPVKDGWSNNYKYLTDSGAQDYSVGSGGKDGSDPCSAFTGTATGSTTNFNCDIVFSTGSFTLYPDGIQQ